MTAPPRLTSLSERHVRAFGVESALAMREDGASWEEIGRACDVLGAYGPYAAHESAHAIWEAAGEPGAPRWEDQPLLPDGRWADGAAARAYFSSRDEAFARWVASMGGL